METNRVALINYAAPDGTRCVASGLFVDGRRVLTADHVAMGTGHRIDFPGGSRNVVAIIRSASVDVDLAVLTVSEPIEVVTPLRCARVDRNRVSRLSGCVAVGFPRWRRDRGARRSAQVNGWMPTAEGLEPTADFGLRAGFLTLVGDRIPGAPDIPAGTLMDIQPNPWGGMSGAGVVADGMLLGVVRSHNLASGGQSLTVTPLTAIGLLRFELQQMFWQALGVADPALLPVLPDENSQASTRDSSDPTGEYDNLRRIREYLHAARMHAEQHPYALALQDGSGLPTVPDLPMVYLHQKVSPQFGKAQRDIEASGSAESAQPYPYATKFHITEEQSRKRLAKAADQSAIQIAETLQRLDIYEILNKYRGVVLVGGPGAGKSSLLRHILYKFSTVFPDENDNLFIPVLVQARAIVGNRPLPEAIASAVMADLGSLLSDSDWAGIFADHPQPGIPWLVLLDGIDEILNREDRRRVLLTIAHWWADPRYRFLITSRMLPLAEFHPLGNVHAPFFEIQQFNENELSGFARRWFIGLGASEGSHLVDNFMSQLVQNRMVQLARNPLIATMMCVIFAKDPKRTLPHSRADLYEQFVALLMDKAFYQLHELEHLQERLSPYGSLSQDAIGKVLASSRHLMEKLAGERLASPKEKSLVECAEVLTAARRPQNVPTSAWRGVLEEILRQSGVTLEQGDDFVFIHDTVMEYLAACESAKKGPRMIAKWRLRIAAGRGDSSALFTISVMYRNKIDLIGRAPKILALRRLVHARLVASLSYEGLDLPASMVHLARERLASFAAWRHNCIPDVVRDHVWDYEDDCVLAAKSLVLLDQDSGLVALARAAGDPAVGGFNIYRYNEVLDLDRERGLSVLADISSSPEMEGFDRAGVALYLLDESRDLGLRAVERLSLDQSVEEIFRAEMAYKLLALDRDRGVRVLTCLVADPLMRQSRSEYERCLAEMDRHGCSGAMVELITNSETGFVDRFGTVLRLMALDRSLALRALEKIAADARINCFARVRAAVVLSEESPSAGMRALRALSRDEHAPGFHRVFCLEWSWRTTWERDRLFELLALTSNCRMGDRWRVFAAEQLAGIDLHLGLQALGDIHGDRTVGRSWRRRAMVVGAVLRRHPGWLGSANLDNETPRSAVIEPSMPSDVHPTVAHKRTQRQLARMERTGYRSLRSQSFSGSPEFIDYLVVGPTGAYMIVSESWDKRLPVRTKDARQLWHGPFSKRDRLEHARCEAKRASDWLTGELHRDIYVQPAIAVYGPIVPWDVATIREVNVFSGARLRRYFRRNAGMKDRPKFSAAEIVQVYAAAARMLPLSGGSRHTP